MKSFRITHRRKETVSLASNLIYFHWKYRKSGYDSLLQHASPSNFETSQLINRRAILFKLLLFVKRKEKWMVSHRPYRIDKIRFVCSVLGNANKTTIWHSFFFLLCFVVHVIWNGLIECICGASKKFTLKILPFKSRRVSQSLHQRVTVSTKKREIYRKPKTDIATASKEIHKHKRAHVFTSVTFDRPALPTFGNVE